MKKTFFLFFLLFQPSLLLPALRPASIHHFSEHTHAHFSGQSHHHYYTSPYPIAQQPGVIGAIVYSVKVGVLGFISETVSFGLKMGLGRLFPQLYTDAATRKTKDLLCKKTELENKLAALQIKEREQKLLEHSGILIADHQKHLAALQSLPLTLEQQKRCTELSNQALDSLELHSRKIQQFLRTP